MHEITSIALPDIGPGAVKTVRGFDLIHAEYPDLLRDESNYSSGRVDFLFFPKDETELSAVLREMNRQKIPVTIAGARSGLVGGSVPTSGALISLEKLDRIEAIHYNESAGEWRVIAQAAVNLNSLAALLHSRRNPFLEEHPDPAVRQAFERFKHDPRGYFYPPDPTEMSASIGGTVATNASGARSYRYGPTRSWIRSLRVFLASGEYLDIPRGKYFASPAGTFTIYNSHGQGITFTIPDYELPRTKNAAGIFSAPNMDLIDLFIGSEGILGVITRVEIALLPRNNKMALIQFLDSEAQAIQLTQAMRRNAALKLDFLEFYSSSTLDLLRNLNRDAASPVDTPDIPSDAHCALFFEMDTGPTDGDAVLLELEQVAAACGADLASSWAAFDEREMEPFRKFRHLVPESINRLIAERKQSFPGIHKLGTDLAVPDEHLAEMWELYRRGCEAAGLEWYAFGHIGNNHIHVNILPRDITELEKGLELFEVFAQKAVALGGTVSAEHGIGKLKHRFFRQMFSPAEIEQMRQVKAAFDPAGILNPGNMLP